MAVDWDLKYDRSVDDEFVALFERGAALGTLTEYAKHAAYPVDLQFRKNPKTNDQRATVYVGLTGVLNVHWRLGKPTNGPAAGRIRVKPAASHAKLLSLTTGVETGWVAADGFDSIRVEDYLDRAIPAASVGSSVVEGAVQSAVASFQTRRQTILDREFILHFRNSQVRTRVLHDVSADLKDALASFPSYPKKPLGGECDLLAVDMAGRLRAVEVKPRDVKTIVWAPAQVIVYARLINRWLAEDDKATQTLSRVFEQRRQLGLIGPRTLAPAWTNEAVPVLAIQRGSKPSLLACMQDLIGHLQEHGIREASQLEVNEVNLAGRLIPMAA